MARGVRMKGLATRLWVVSLALVLVAGCTATGDQDPTAAGSGTDGSEVGTSERGSAVGSSEESGGQADDGTVGADADEGDAEEDSPLVQFLGGSSAPLDEATRASLNAELIRDLRERERLIAECMAAQGFTYHPMDPSDWHTERPGGDVWLLPEDEFAAQYGFGITTIDREEEVVPESPNQAVFEAMSESERQQWLAAMWGDGTYGGLDMGEDGEPMAPFDADGKGCFGEAHEAMTPPDPQMDRLDAEYQGLFEEFGALERRIEADPRAEVAARRWSDCMADAGYPGLGRPGDAESIVHDRLDQLTDGGTVADLRTSDREALQALEIELAVAEHACMEDFVVVTTEIRHEHEERFIEEHRAELERYRDAMSLLEEQQ
jgi:hypothetical protein